MKLLDSIALSYTNIHIDIFEFLSFIHHCMCKELPVIPVYKVLVDPKRIIGENGEMRRWRGTRGR
jgi:hypothetical protein